MSYLIAYLTEHQTSQELIKRFSKGISKSDKNWNVELKSINDFFQNGLPKNVDGVLIHGILRGTGHVIREAIKSKIDYYYIDHAYFNAGYKGQFWNRISKNNLSINYSKNVSDERWKIFSKDLKIKPWRKENERGKNILIIPPTSAIKWFFNVKDWYKNLIIYLAKNYGDDFLKKVKVRIKPNEPIVDENGNLLGIKELKKEHEIPIEEDLENASLVIAFNSNVALEATRKGIPVIVDNSNACNSISFYISDLNSSLDNPKFNQEPDRINLFKWLSYCQFNINEIENGTAWDIIQTYQN